MEAAFEVKNFHKVLDYGGFFLVSASFSEKINLIYMPRFKTAKAALAFELLQGNVINVRTLFNTVGLTNCAREVSRMIEIPFSVVVSRTPKSETNKYGQSVSWVNYRLNKTDMNKEGIKKMWDYVDKNMEAVNPKTKTDIRGYQQTEMNF